MSIERMKRVWLLVDVRQLRTLLKLLSRHELMHVADLSKPASESEILGTVTTDLTRVDNRIAGLHHALDVFNAFDPLKRSIEQNFLTLPLNVTGQEYQQARRERNAEDLVTQTVHLAETHAGLVRKLEEVKTNLNRLEPFRQTDVEAPPTFRTCVGQLGIMTLKSFQKMMSDDDVETLSAAFRLAGKNRSGLRLVEVVSLQTEEAEVSELLRKYEFESLSIPEGRSIRQIVCDLETESEDLDARVRKVVSQIRELAQAHRRELTIRLAQLETGRNTLATFEKAASSDRVAVLGGYVRAREIDKLEKLLEDEVPSAGMEIRDPDPEETVPVSLRTSWIFAPGQFLVEMFGVPTYHGLDPSPFITFNFLLFFGFCFGDTIYGLLLFVLGCLLARRYRADRDKKLFFMLLAYGGFASLIVGMLTGSWAADIWQEQYLGQDNIFMRVVKFFQITDPLNKPMLALMVALVIGVLNQFYGIFMRMYSEVKRGRVAAAVFDGGLWFLYLPGLLMLGLGAADLFDASWIMPTGMALTVTGAVGLVLTQGRHEKTFLAKAIVGVISLYGIMGTYGTTSFVGDTLSYCRLLALGLTTTVVGICFNLIGGLVRGIPYAGLALFIVVLLIGHLFNFVVSILGAFVHSARLIFVEFFGRFYDESGQRFQPLRMSERVRVIDNPD